MLTALMKERLAALEGLIPDAVGLTLAELASSVSSEHAIVEIGSYKGKSTCYLAAGAQVGQRAQVFAVDPWDTPGNPGGRFGFDTRTVRADFHAQVRLMELETAITPLQGFSWEVVKTWKKPIGLLYIDGSHTEKDVMQDWRLWSRFLVPGARVAFDDYDTPRNPGVKKVIERIQRERNDIRWSFGPPPLAIGATPVWNR